MKKTVLAFALLMLGFLFGWFSCRVSCTLEQFSLSTRVRMVGDAAQFMLERLLAIGDDALTKQYAEGLAVGIQKGVLELPDKGCENMEFFMQWQREIGHIETSKALKNSTDTVTFEAEGSSLDK